MSNDYSIAEVESFTKQIKKPHFKQIYSKIKSLIYPQLRKNPFFGPNIKKLKRTLEDYYRYRIGNYRLFYRIDSEKVIVFIITIKNRKDAYK